MRERLLSRIAEWINFNELSCYLFTSKHENFHLCFSRTFQFCCCYKCWLQCILLTAEKVIKNSSQLYCLIGSQINQWCTHTLERTFRFCLDDSGTNSNGFTFIRQKQTLIGKQTLSQVVSVLLLLAFASSNACSH